MGAAAVLSFIHSFPQIKKEEIRGKALPCKLL